MLSSQEKRRGAFLRCVSQLLRLGARAEIAFSNHHCAEIAFSKHIITNQLGYCCCCCETHAARTLSGPPKARGVHPNVIMLVRAFCEFVLVSMKIVRTRIHADRLMHQPGEKSHEVIQGTTTSPPAILLTTQDTY
jgi:hypothetical protein